MAVAWTVVALFGAFLVASLGLPWNMPLSLYDDVQRSDLFRGEWLVAGTFLVFPVAYAARASRLAAVVAVVLPSAQMLYVADTAVDNATWLGVATEMDRLWYLVAGAQVIFFASVGIVSAYRGADERRWLGYLAELESDSAALPRTRRD